MNERRIKKTKNGIITSLVHLFKWLSKRKTEIANPITDKILDTKDTIKKNDFYFFERKQIVNNANTLISKYKKKKKIL